MNEPTPHVSDDQLDDPRLELITDYLIGELDADQVAAVKRRLDEDADFREYCAPLILAWSVPPRHEREPMSRAELAKHWDNFTKRAGFAHQRRRARRNRLTILGIIVVAFGVSSFALKDRVSARYHDRRDYHALPYAAGWIPFGRGREVQLSADARLRVANKESGAGGVLAVRLTGTARFRTLTTDTTSLTPQLHLIAVETAGGWAMAGSGEFTVSAHADTTEVEVHHPALRQFVGFMPLPTTTYVTGIDRDLNALTLREGQRGRVVRGGKPVLLRQP